MLAAVCDVGGAALARGAWFLADVVLLGLRIADAVVVSIRDGVGGTRS